MIAPRRSFEEGHRRKFLVVVDETPECNRAALYAAKRAQRTGGALVMLYVIAPADFQHWRGVEELMREEARERAEARLEEIAAVVRANSSVEPEMVIREGSRTEELLALIAEDEDIAILVLAAGTGAEGPGPLVSSIAKAGDAFPIPVTIVPSTLTDADIETLA